MKRTIGQIVLTVLFALLALNAWAQVVLFLLGRADDPASLMGLQFASGATAAAASWGSWTTARWSPAAALSHGVATAGMLFALPALLGLPAEARGGIRTGAAMVFLFSALAAWYLRRIHHRAENALAAQPR